MKSEPQADYKLVFAEKRQVPCHEVRNAGRLVCPSNMCSVRAAGH